MSDPQENELHRQVTKNSPGKCLRKARESRGLSRKDIAERLHLSEQVIDAIERDDQDHLPTPIFVRGYLRSYAPLVALDADSVIADYNNYFADIVDVQEVRDVVQVGIGSKSTGRAKFGRVWVYLALVVFVVVGVGYFTGQESIDSGSEQESVINSENNRVNTGAESVDSPYQVSASDSGDLQKQPLSKDAGQAIVSTSADDDINIDSGSSQGKDTEKTKEPSMLSSRNYSGLLDGNGEAFPSPEPVDVRPAGVDSLKMQFHADAWTEVSDANGDRLLYRLGREGRTYQVTGVAPFKVLLGNAREVTVIVNGQMFDHIPFIRGQVARFSASKELAGEKSAGESSTGE